MCEDRNQQLTENTNDKREKFSKSLATRETQIKTMRHRFSLFIFYVFMSLQ